MFSGDAALVTLIATSVSLQKNITTFLFYYFCLTNPDCYIRLSPKKYRNIFVFVFLSFFSCPGQLYN